MLSKFNFFRCVCSFCLVFAMSVLAFGDTIRLKDGSIIKGKIVNFTGGTFTVAIGDGSRQRQMTFSANDIESIQFDGVQTPTGAVKTSNSSTENQIPVSGNKIITVGQNSRTSDVPPPAPKIIKTDNTLPTEQQNSSQAQNKTPQTVVPDNTESNSVSNTNSAAKPKPIELNVKVLADNTSNGWTNSGWVVRKGQKIRISGDGRVSLGGGRFSTPSGISTLPDNDKLMKNVPTGALIAVIGDDNNEFVYVGNEREFTAERDGSLFLGINEGNLNDNSGVFDVKIQIDAAPGN